MNYLDLTFETPAENLACDEALLNMCESGFHDEILRWWEAQQHFVVLGYSNRALTEVHLQHCLQRGIPVLRRCSGGGAVVQGPGCLNYALVLRKTNSPFLQSISRTNAYVLERHKEALSPMLGPLLSVQGISDLAIGTRKFSGNAQRRAGDFVLFHGTMLVDFDIDLMDDLLPLPTRQPGYRGNRSHQEFLTNLQMPRESLKDAIQRAWSATERLERVPTRAIGLLVKTRYQSQRWISRL